MRDGGPGSTLSTDRRRLPQSVCSVMVPLGENQELYAVQILFDGEIRRETQVATPSFTYTSAMKTADGVSGAFDFAAAQVSDRFGPGPFGRITVDE